MLTEEGFAQLLRNQAAANEPLGAATGKSSPELMRAFSTLLRDMPPRHDAPTPISMENPAKVKTPRPRQNKWEREYDAKLRAMYGRGEIQWYEFEGMTLRLADDTRYTPDFAVMHNDGHVEMVEVKGFIREDALVKFKVAAERFPFEFCMYRKQKVSEGGGWDLIKAIRGGKR